MSAREAASLQGNQRPAELSETRSRTRQQNQSLRSSNSTSNAAPQPPQITTPQPKFRARGAVKSNSRPRAIPRGSVKASPVLDTTASAAVSEVADTPMLDPLDNRDTPSSELSSLDPTDGIFTSSPGDSTLTSPLTSIYSNEDVPELSPTPSKKSTTPTIDLMRIVNNTITRLTHDESRNPQTPAKATQSKTPPRKKAKMNTGEAVDASDNERSLVVVLQLPCANPSPVELRQHRAFINRPHGVVGACKDWKLWLAAILDFEQSHLTEEERGDPIGEPKVWSLGRQALCEALSEFRAQQSAMQAKNGLIKGMFLDSLNHTRDQFDTQTIICRSGGGLTLDKDGEYVDKIEEASTVEQARDYGNRQMVSFRFTAKMEQSVLMLVSKQATFTQFCSPKLIVALGYYKPTFCWYEKYGKQTVGRLLFTNLRHKDPVWFDTPNNKEKYKVGDLPPPFTHTCPDCKQDWPRVNIQGWMCLNSKCKSFYKYSDGTEPIYEDLRYDPSFVKQDKPWSHNEPSSAIKPPLAHDLVSASAGAMGSFAASQGFCCPKCGCCGIRRHWAELKCADEACDWRFDIPLMAPDPESLASWDEPVGYGPARTNLTWSPDKEDGGPHLNLQPFFRQQYLAPYNCSSIGVPGRSGRPASFLVVLRANKTVHEVPITGTHDLFRDVYNSGLLKKIERKPKTDGPKRGPSFSTMYFANYGEDYKFVVTVPSTPFDEAPKVVLNSRNQLTEGAKLAHAFIAQQYGTEFLPKFEDFNEILALGYMVKHGINWHDDGETGVGSTVGTLSLGGDAFMQLRVHKKHYFGYSKEGVFARFEPIPGSFDYEWRLKMFPEHMRRVTAAKGEDKLKEVLKELGAELKAHARKEFKGKMPQTPKSLVQIQLSHGDMVFMIGEDFQRFYEHTVMNESPTTARISMTARTMTNKKK